MQTCHYEISRNQIIFYWAQIRGWMTNLENRLLWDIMLTPANIIYLIKSIECT